MGEIHVRADITITGATGEAHYSIQLRGQDPRTSAITDLAQSAIDSVVLAATAELPKE